MKELSIKEKARRYDEALERAKQFITKELYAECNGNLAEYIFPELAESEDEKIRNELIDFVKSRLAGFPDCKRLTDWLEKQGEHKKFRDSIQVGDKVTRNEDGVLVNLSQLNRVAKKDEKQDEQKPADKVEPKFAIGDWCIDNEDDTIFQIVKVLDNTYTYKTIEGKEYSCTHYSLENDARLWTIQDAKDGDVLCYKDEISLYKHDIKNCTKQGTTFGGFVYHCCYDDKILIMDSLYSLTEQDKIDIRPATKKQRDLLEKAMDDAGYTFDFEKKELKKIEQKPSWSEEDEQIALSIEQVMNCASLLNIVPEKMGKIRTWLKSLKEKYTWRPSDEQLNTLYQYAEQNNYDGSVLTSLYRDLKKLREE